MAKVKVFVHAANADADARAMTLAPRTLSRLAKNEIKFYISLATRNILVNSEL